MFRLAAYGLLAAALASGGAYLKGRGDGRAACEDRQAALHLEQVRAQVRRANRLNEEIEALRAATDAEVAAAGAAITELERALELELAREPETIVMEVERESIAEPDTRAQPRYDCRMSDRARELRDAAIARTRGDG